MKRLLFAVVAGVLSFAAQAQMYGAPITLDQARKAALAAEAEMKKNNWAMTIAIVDSGGHLVYLQRADGSQFAGAKIAEDKAWSAAGFKRPGKMFQDRLASGGLETRILQLRGVSALDGGEPILADGKIIGGIGVSGGSGEQDGQVARAGAGGLK
jgi:glc operon protein GlcG